VYAKRRKSVIRRTTLPEFEELEAVTKDMGRQISRLQEHKEEDEEKESTIASSAVSIDVPVKRFLTV